MSSNERDLSEAGPDLAFKYGLACISGGVSWLGTFILSSESSIPAWLIQPAGVAIGALGGYIIGRCFEGMERKELEEKRLHDLEVVKDRRASVHCRPPMLLQPTQRREEQDSITKNYPTKFFD